MDLDGYEDLLVANGALRDFQNIDMANASMAGMAGQDLTQNEILQLHVPIFPSFERPNYIFRNKGD